MVKRRAWNGLDRLVGLGVILLSEHGQGTKRRRRNMCVGRWKNQPVVTFSGLAPVPACDARIATRPLGYRDDTGTRVVPIWAEVASGPSKLPALICRPPPSFFHHPPVDGASLRHSLKASASTSSSSRPSICFADSIAPHEIGSKSCPIHATLLPLRIFPLKFAHILRCFESSFSTAVRYMRSHRIFKLQYTYNASKRTYSTALTLMSSFFNDRFALKE